MSEGPEVHRICGELNDELAGSRIVSVETRLRKAREWLQAHPGAVEGCRVERVYPAGKNILWELEGGIYFHFHLLMFGKVRTYSLRYRVPDDPTIRAHIVTTSKQFVLMNGQVFNIGVGDPFAQIPSLASIGPDMCALPFDRELFLQRLNRPDNLDQEVGPVLLDQSVAAGLGNYLKSDILFECRINPWTRVRDLTSGEQECLAETIPTVGQRALRGRGQTVTDEVMARISAASGGSSVPWRDKHWVFRQAGRPCKVCGTTIKQKWQGPGRGRVTFYCPQCQGVRDT
jgi:endonuclease-8